MPVPWTLDAETDRRRAKTTIGRIEPMTHDHRLDAREVPSSRHHLLLLFGRMSEPVERS